MANGKNCLSGSTNIFYYVYVTVANMRMANIAFETTIKIIIEEELICHEKKNLYNDDSILIAHSIAYCQLPKVQFWPLIIICPVNGNIFVLQNSKSFDYYWLKAPTEHILLQFLIRTLRKTQIPAIVCSQLPVASYVIIQKLKRKVNQ